MPETTSPLVSIIIPAYNVEAYLPEAIESALAQTYPHTEIIVVDNNSTDRTRAVAEGYQGRFPAKVRVVNAKSPGAPSARNYGLSLARGKWLQYLDADDILLPAKIESQMKAVTPGQWVIGSYLYQRIGGATQPIVTDPVNAWVDLFCGNAGITSANLWPADALRKIGGWQPGLACSQEYELMFRLLQTGVEPLYHAPALTLVRQRAGSISTGTASPIRTKGVLTVHQQVYEYIQTVFPDMYALYRATLNDYLTKYIRDFALHQPAEGRLIYRQYFPRGHRLIAQATGRIYRLLHNGFGFGPAVRLYSSWLRVKARVGGISTHQ